MHSPNKEGQVLKASLGVCCVIAVLLLPITLKAQGTPLESAVATEGPNVRPPVTKADLQIVMRAREILDSPAKWNRADDRECPAGAKTFSLYCALEIATKEVTGKFVHRGAALQELRFVIDEIAGDRNYDHRLMRYNNDSTTTFNDVQEVFRMIESLLTLRLKGGGSQPEITPGQSPTSPADAQNKFVVTRSDIEIVKRARQILDSPSKWNKTDKQDCRAEAKTFSLYCALAKAAKEVSVEFDDAAAIREAKVVVDETAPNRKSYKARLVDFNNDPTTTLADVQKLLQLVEERLTKRLP